LRIGRRLSVAFAVVVALTIASAVFSQIRLMEIQLAGPGTDGRAGRAHLAGLPLAPEHRRQRPRSAMLAMMTAATRT
jgi:hypothetical protein